MARVKVYSTGICPVCENVKNLLKKWSIPYEEARLDTGDMAIRREFMEKTNGARMVPQILIDGEWIGGFTDLTMLHMDGEIDHLVE